MTQLHCKEFLYNIKCANMFINFKKGIRIKTFTPKKSYSNAISTANGRYAS